MLGDLAVQELLLERQRIQKRLAAIDELIGRRQLRPGKGLRGAIRGALARSERPMKPAGVYESIKAHGFRDQIGVKTDLITRVRNELWRMAQKGELISCRARYSLADVVKEKDE